MDNIIENNKLIAEFMGLELPLKITEYSSLICSMNGNYHKDCNWLIEVVEKIESLDCVIDFKITIEYVEIIARMGKRIVFKNCIFDIDYRTTKREVIYNACVEFIKWYNKQNKKMKNIYILPTDKPSRLWLSTRKENYLIFDKFPRGCVEYVEPKNIYITSDETTKCEEYWHYNKVLNIVSKKESSGYEKIILTTDKDLIKDGVQAIDDEFLEWFIRNPNCEFVNVENDYLLWRNSEKDKLSDCCKIIIPKEEYKNETPEEAAERLYPTTINSFTDSGFDMSETERLIFINGAKWQKEQDKKLYSEEDLHNAFYNGWIYRGDNYTFPKAKKEWIEHYKKK